MADTNQLGLPYKEITQTANRTIVRANASRGGRETMYVDLKKIRIREGFNIRKEYHEIPELSLFIQFNGLPAPLVIDMLPDGSCFIEQGHRRYKALMLLKEKGYLKDMELPGIKPGGKVECFINDTNTDELTRLKRQFSSNNGDKYTPLEFGELCKRMRDFFNLNMTDIAKELGCTRQHVSNMITLAEQPDSIKEAVKNKGLSATTAVELSRKVGDDQKRADMVSEAGNSGKVMKGTDVKRLEGEDEQGNAKGQRDSKSGEVFDESRDEIKLCNNAIKNVDKLNTLASKIDNEGFKKDFDKTVGWIQKDLAEIRLWISKNKKK